MPQYGAILTWGQRIQEELQQYQRELGDMGSAPSLLRLQRQSSSSSSSCVISCCYCIGTVEPRAPTAYHVVLPTPNRIMQYLYLSRGDKHEQCVTCTNKCQVHPLTTYLLNSTAHGPP
jgi:hypothetical protein